MKISFSPPLFQEFHLSQTYHEGLLKLQAKEYEKARELLEAVLKDPLIANAQVLVAALTHSLFNNQWCIHFFTLNC